MNWSPKHSNLLDILFFFESEDCVDGNGFYNVSMTEGTGHVPVVTCTDEGTV